LQLAADYSDVCGGFNTNTNGVPSETDDGNRDVVADEDTLTDLSRQHEHDMPLPWIE